MDITKASSSYTVIDSGILFFVEGFEPTKIRVRCDDSFAFNIAFSFNSDESGKLALNQNAEGDTVTFVCTNFNSAEGVGTNRPVEIATYNGKPISLIFRVYLLPGGQMRKVEYSVTY